LSLNLAIAIHADELLAIEAMVFPKAVQIKFSGLLAGKAS
jgi:hypothetical protein